MAEIKRLTSALGRRLGVSSPTPSPTEPGRPPRPIVDERPRDARKHNLRTVVEALEGDDVPFVFVRADRAQRTVVAVRELHARRMIEAIARTDSLVGIVRDGVLKPQIVASENLVETVGDLDLVEILRVYEDFADPHGSLTYGRDLACDVEIWRPGERGTWCAPRTNAISTVFTESDLETVPFDVDGLVVPMARAFERTAIDDIDFPIDAVYLWVDGNDPAWSERMRSHRPVDEQVHADAVGAQRFRTFDELRYSLRSLDMNAPWIRKVFLVTDRQVPDFIRGEHEDLVVVDHSEIAPAEYLPMFNSDAISSWMHRVPGLSEHFVYLNDDVFFGRPIPPSLFFDPSGVLKVFPSNNQRPLDPVSADDSLATAKAKRLRALIEERHGRTIAYIVRHTAHAMTKSMMELIETDFAEDVERTRRSRFRTPTDMPIEQMVHYVSQIVGTGTRGSATYGYVGIGSPEALGDFEKVVSNRNRDMFCLNDDGQGAEPDAVRIAELLHEMFPVPSRWERPIN